MKEQLYRKLDETDALEEGDIWGNDGNLVESVFFGDLAGEDFSYPAFRPVSAETATGSVQEGEAERLKLLREHYAGLAMQGYTTLVTPENVKLHREKGPKMPIEDYMALLSVQMADALIAALNKKEGA